MNLLISVLISICLPLISFSKHDENKTPEPQDGINRIEEECTDNEAAGTWTIMVYMIGSDLESQYQSGSLDLLEMLEVGSTENLNVIVCTGGSVAERWQEVNYYRVLKGSFEPLAQMGKQDMVNPETLGNFALFSMANYPADNYGLILWNHGAGIDGFGTDELSGRSFSLNSLTQTLQDIYAITNIKYDLLGFDACLMATLEVASKLSGLAEYMVASEELEPAHGWDYRPVLRSLAAGYIDDGADLGRVIAEGFRAQASEYGTKGVTLSVIDLDDVGYVLQALEELSTAPSLLKMNDFTSLARSRIKSEAYGRSAQHPALSYDGIDLEDFARYIKQEQPELAGEAQRLIDAIRNAVVYNVYDDTKPNASGLTIFFPFEKLSNDQMLESAMNLYDGLNFSKPYNDLINRFVGRAEIDEEAPVIIPENIYEEENFIGAISTSTDIAEVYMVLIDATGVEDGTVEFLGMMLPDYHSYIENGGVELSHEWDGTWVGINDYPAYISDIFIESYINEATGQEDQLVIILIPAMLNDQEVILTYSVDSEGGYVLQSINPEVEAENMYKRGHMDIKPGDQLSLVYEAYNLETEEEYWYPGVTFELQSKEDLELTISELESGAYLLGIMLTDYAKNSDLFLGDNIYFVE